MGKRLFGIFIGATLLFGPSDVRAQGWLEATQKAAEATTEGLQESDPKELVLDQFGRNRELERGAEKLRDVVSQLEQVTSSPPSPYDRIGSLWKEQEKRTVPSVVEKLTGEETAQYLDYEVQVGNHEYRVYKVGQTLIPFDPNAESLPLDHRLQRVLEVSAVRGLSRPVSRNHLRAVEDISNVTVRAASLIDRYGTKSLQTFRQIESTTIMGTSAATAVDGLVRSASGGIGLYGLKGALSGAVESANEVGLRARKVSRNVERVRSELPAVRGRKVNAERALIVKRRIAELGSMVREIFDPYTRMQESVSPVRDRVGQLREFVGLPSVRFAAQSAYLVDQSIPTVGSQVEEYAVIFSRFAEVTERMSSKQAQETRSRLEPALDQIIDPTLAEANTLHSSFRRLIDLSPRWMVGRTQLRSYDRKLIARKEEIRSSRSTDVVQSLQAKRELDTQVKRLPTTKVKAIGASLVERAKERQLFGTPETRAAQIALGRLEDGASPKEVAATATRIAGVMRSVRIANRRLYFALGGFALIIGGVMVWRG